MCRSDESGERYPAPRCRTFDVLPNGEENTVEQIKARNEFWETFNMEADGVEDPTKDRSEIFTTRKEAQLALDNGCFPLEFDETYTIKPVYIIVGF
jgi:hypothetical protein